MKSRRFTNEHYKPQTISCGCQVRRNHRGVAEQLNTSQKNDIDFREGIIHIRAREFPHGGLNLITHQTARKLPTWIHPPNLIGSSA